MAPSRILILASALTGVLASGIVARDTMSNHIETQTALPQELGSTTSDGYFVYTVNFCTIVRRTDCETELSTGGAVPTDFPGTPSASTSMSGTSATESTSSSASEPTESDPVGGGDDMDGAAALDNTHAYLYGVAGVAAAVLA